MLRIQKVTPQDGFRVQLELTDGSVVDRDLQADLVGPIFEPLRNDVELFRQVDVVDGSLTWPNGIDMCPDMVIWGGPPPADSEAKAS